MRTWEHSVSYLLHLFRLDSIKSKILLLSILATLIPSLSMGWISYRMMTQYLDKEIAEQLRNVTAQTARELELWLKERRYELRVFASSYEVSENTDTLIRTQGRPPSKAEAQRRLEGYLRSVRGKFPDYEEILVVDRYDQPLVTTAKQPGEVRLPANWMKRVAADTSVVGDAYADPARLRVITMAVPIRSSDGSFLGALVAKANLRTLVDLLKQSSLSAANRLVLITSDGAVISSSQWRDREFDEERLPTVSVQALSEAGGHLLEYEGASGPVLGSLRWLTQADWGVVAELGKREAYRDALTLRTLIVTMLAGILLVIGLVSYLLGQAIVRPLKRLTRAAASVAGGNLSVTVPVVGYGEIGYLTEVFNHMVHRLREAQEQLATTNRLLSVQNQELESVALTDSLTGLYNRKYLMEKLADEMARSLRHEQPFSILMLDLDNFKRYNDTYGHLAGDQLLKRAALLFTDTIRQMDVAARYGGEEFVIILPEINGEQALEPAERLRERVARELVTNEQVPVTISIGLAEFPVHGENSMELIGSADAALYHAKRLGRNRVVLAGSWIREKA